MTQVDDFKSPWNDKDATTVNDTAYTFLNPYYDEISDSDKKVEASRYPIKDTHVVSIQPSPELESLDEGDVASPKAWLAGEQA